MSKKPEIGSCQVKKKIGLWDKSLKILCALQRAEFQANTCIGDQNDNSIWDILKRERCAYLGATFPNFIDC